MTPYTYHIYYNIYYKKPFPSSFFPFPKGLLFHSVPHFGHLVKKKQSLRRKINRTKLFVTNNFLYFCPLKSKDDSMRKKKFSVGRQNSNCESPFNLSGQ